MFKPAGRVRRFIVCQDNVYPVIFINDTIPSIENKYLFNTNSICPNAFSIFIQYEYF